MSRRVVVATVATNYYAFEWYIDFVDFVVCFRGGVIDCKASFLLVEQGTNSFDVKGLIFSRDFEIYETMKMLRASKKQLCHKQKWKQSYWSYF